MYIRFIPSYCICDVFHSVFSMYVHLMYIFLSLFSVDGFYCAILLDIVLICCCTPDNDVDSPSPDMGRHISGRGSLPRRGSLVAAVCHDQTSWSRRFATTGNSVFEFSFLLLR